MEKYREIKRDDEYIYIEALMEDYKPAELGFVPEIAEGSISQALHFGMAVWKQPVTESERNPEAASSEDAWDMLAKATMKACARHQEEMIEFIKQYKEV